MKATVWTVLSYGAGQGLRVVNSLILTRMLLPAAFGRMALVTTLIVGMALLSDLGLNQSIVQSKRGDDPMFLNTAWTIQAIRGITDLGLRMPAGLAGVGVLQGPDACCTCFRCWRLTSIISAFCSTGLLSLSRHMGMKRLFFLEFSQQIVALIVTVACAYVWPNVWALVVGNLASNALSAGAESPGRAGTGCA